MVEADLPDMATKKAARLLVSGRLGDHHQVMPIDILAESGEQTLEAVFARAFDSKEPVVVVTEGTDQLFFLAGYFRILETPGGTAATAPGFGLSVR